MTKLVRCPGCGTRTDEVRELCPRCDAPLTGAPLVAGSAERQAISADDPSRHESTPKQRSVFDTDISALFPKRKRFGVADFLLLAGLVAWTALASDLRIWVQGGLSTFGMTAAEEGVARAELSPALDAVETTTPDAVVETDALDGTSAPETEPVHVPHADLMNAGNLAFEAGAFETARARFAEAAAGTPTDPRAHNNLGQALVRLGEGEAALTYFEEAVRLDPERWAYQFNLAHNLGELGWWNRAAARYRQTIPLRPGDHSARYNMARALHNLGDYRGAVESYLEAIALAPDESRFFLSIGGSYEALNRPADAMVAYTRYLEMEPASDNGDAVRRRLEELEGLMDTDPKPSQAP
jgi:Flp pilus assembly protein TadD